MEYFAGLDISMKETHICVVDRDGKVVYEAKAFTSPAAIAAELAKAPAAQRMPSPMGDMMIRSIRQVRRSTGLPDVSTRSMRPSSLGYVPRRGRARRDAIGRRVSSGRVCLRGPTQPRVRHQPERRRPSSP
jgi:hypothetical protein